MNQVVPPGSRVETARAEEAWQSGDVSAEIRDIVKHLRARRGVIVVAGLLPRDYTAKSQIMLDPVGLRIFANPVVQNGEVPDIQSSMVETQARVLRSDVVLNQVVEQEHLDHDPEFNGHPARLIPSLLQHLRALLPGRTPDDEHASALSALGDAVQVQRNPGSFVLDLSVRSEDAAKAKRLADAIADAFIDNQQKSGQDAASQVSESLTLRLEGLAREVNQAEKAVDDFKRDNNIVGAKGQLLNEQQLADLVNAQTAARVHLSELRARYQQIRQIEKSGISPDATIEVLNSAAIVALRTRYAEVKQTESNLASTVGPRHPSLLIARAQVNNIRTLLAEETSRISASAKADYDRALASDNEQSRAIAEATAATGNVNTAEIRLRELEREAQARRAVYESSLNRAREAREQVDLTADNIKVISPASVLPKRAGLPAIVVVIIAIVFGDTLACIGIIAADRLSGRLVTPRQFGLLTDLPMLADVAVQRTSSAGKGMAGTQDSAPSIRRPSLQAVGELIKAIAPEEGPRVILFLSTSRRASDAWLPVDLAVSECEGGARVLFVDADDGAIGRALEGASATNVRRQAGVRRTGIANLKVLCGGSGLPGSVPRREVDDLDNHAASIFDYDFVFIHGQQPGNLSRFKALTARTTNVLLIVDASDGKVGQVHALRQGIGRLASKVDGFIWLTTSKTARPARRDGRTPQRAPVARPQTNTTVAV